MHIYYSSKEVLLKDFMIILALGFFGIAVLGYFATGFLCQLFRSVDGLPVLLRLGYWILNGIMIFLYGFLVFSRARNELVFGVSDEDGRFYRLPCRKMILRDAQFYEVSHELEERMNKQMRLPGVPQNSQEIVKTLDIQKKDGYYLIKCMVKLPKYPEPRRQDYGLPMFYNDMDELLDQFRKLM